MWGNPVMKIPKKNLSYAKKQKLKGAYGEDAIHESDVPIETRVLVDLYDENRISEGHRRFFYDIEVATDEGFPSPDKANQKITALSYYDESSSRSAVLVLDEDEDIDKANHSGIEVFTYSEEERLLKGILKHWRNADPTIISGWNCVPTSSLVWGEDEIKPIRSLENGDQISGAGSSVERIYPKSVREKYVLSLGDGTKVSSSKNHRFPVVEKTGKYTRLTESSSTCESQEMSAEEIQECDNEVYLRYRLGENPNQKSEYSKEEAYLAGLIFADGHYSEKENRVSIYNNNRSIIDSVSEHFSREPYEDDRHENSTYHLRSRRENTNHWTQVLSLIYENGEKCLDVQKLSRLPTDLFCSFLSGLIDGDGHLGECGSESRCIQVALYNGKAQSLVSLLRWNGIDCSLTSDGNVVHVLPEKRTLEILQSHLDLQHSQKKSRLDSYEGYEDKGSPSHCIRKMRRDDYCLVRVNGVENTEEKVEMIDIKTDTRYFNIGGGFKTHNSSDFDDPYLYNRLKKVLGKNEANKLSPIGKVREKRTPSGESGYKFAGIASLDYLNIYKNFTFSQKPSYSLDHVSNKELDRGKVEYEGMEVNGETVRDLDDLKRLDIKRFVEYSHEDVQLIVDIDEKLNFIEMARRISHLGHVPYEDVYMSSRFIEGAILSRLHKEGRVAPDNDRNKTRFEADGRHRLGSSEIQVQKDKIHEDIPKKGMIGVDKASTKTKREKVEYKRIDGDRFVLKEGIDFEVEDGASIGLEFAGAYVKEPDPGIYEWIYDLDLTSMYPCIIMGLNISPETKVAKIYDWDVYDFAEKPDKEYKVWIFSRSDWKHFSGPGDLQAWAKRNKYSVAANGAVYKNDRRGVIADLLEEWFENRQEYKARRNEARERGDEEKAEYYDKQQHNRKILINCFTPDHEIMTKEGVKSIEDVEVGEEVYSINTETGERELKPVVRTYKQDEYSGDIIKFKNDLVDLAVTPNHDMVFGEDLKKEKAGNVVGKERTLPPPTSKDDPVKLNPEDTEGAYYQGPIVCVEVKDNHTVLAGRNGTFNWTGQSVYGVLGLPVFRFHDLGNAEATTATGVSTIKYTSKMGDHYYQKHGECEDERLMKNVYSDSVPDFEPVIVRDENGVVDIVPIEDLEGRWQELEVWSDEGWTEIKSFIKKPNNKEIYRTKTGEGIVHTTGDHSLVRENGEEVSPKEIEVGQDRLLHNQIPRGVDWKESKKQAAGELKKALNSKNRRVVESFLSRFRDGKAYKTEFPVVASGISYLLQRLGFEVEISREDNAYSISPQIYVESKEVRGVEKLDYDPEYVYDLETESDHFHCGIGSIVVHNTDSVFYSAIPLLDEKPEEMEEDEIINATIEKATELQEYLNDSYDYYAQKILNIPEGQHRFDIKQELVASRGIWMEAKKRYAQWIVNDEGDPTSELDVKGMDIVRSDFPPAFDDVMEEVVITILKENDQEKVDQIIMDFEDRLHDFGLFEVANPTGVGDASDYQEDEIGQYKKGAPVYFKAALAYNDLIDHFNLSYEKISDDSKIKWVYLHENPLGLDQVGFKNEDNPDRIMDFARQYADYDKMYEKALKSKLEDIYDAIGWDFPSAGKKRAEEFFQFS